MSNALLVEILHGRDDLLHDARGVLLRVLALLDDLFEQLLAVDTVRCTERHMRVSEKENHHHHSLRRERERENVQLHDKVELILVLVDLVQLEDVGMVDLAHDLDLAPQELDVLALDRRLLDALDGVLLVGRLLGRVAHLGEATTVRHVWSHVSDRHNAHGTRRRRQKHKYASGHKHVPTNDFAERVELVNVFVFDVCVVVVVVHCREPVAACES